MLKNQKNFSLETKLLIPSFDFLGNLSRLNGYSVAQVEETTEEKLSRISRELEEIKLQDQTARASQQVDQLLTILSELKSENNTTTINFYVLIN